jgi:DNA-binding response OmpR family regulator
VTSPQPIRLAIVDDDSGFVTVVAKRAETAGWQLRAVAGAIPPEELVEMKLDALLIDPAVLGEGAWSYLEQVCGMLPDLGVLVCTAPTTVAERVRGLRLGADDWLAKPCHAEEVIARIEAVSRRHRQALPQLDVGPLVVGELEIRPDRFQAYVGGKDVGLTRREFELLTMLAESTGRVHERGAIYQRVWGYAMAHGDRSVDVFVRKLRQKLTRRSPGWTYIHTHFGVGYRFDPEPLEGVVEPLDGASEAPGGASEAPAPSRSQPFHKLDTSA